jgi:hypothetical protein
MSTFAWLSTPSGDSVASIVAPTSWLAIASIVEGGIAPGRSRASPRDTVLRIRALPSGRTSSVATSSVSTSVGSLPPRPPTSMSMSIASSSGVLVPFVRW